MQETAENNSSIFSYSYWENQLSTLNKEYYTAQPFPHLALDNFLPEQTADLALKEFPAINDSSWINYLHVNERKHGLNKMEALPRGIQTLIKELNSERFVALLSRITGIDNLIPDVHLEGGGLHQTERGGFLNIHADFTVHPHYKNRRRRVNLILYLNTGWKDEYNGHLELWSRDMKQCVQRIAPLFNRCVIFNTDATSYHGHPDKLNCLPGMTRKSIALYYYTEEQSKITINATNYKARPDDGLKKVGIYADSKALQLYTWLKSIFGLSDNFASNVLRFLSISKRKKK